MTDSLSVSCSYRWIFRFAHNRITIIIEEYEQKKCTKRHELKVAEQRKGEKEEEEKKNKSRHVYNTIKKKK